MQSATLPHALVFAVNEGVTYWVPNEEIRAKYAAIAAELSKILRQPVTIEPIAAYPALRQGLAEKAYDLAMVHPAQLSIVAMKNSGYKLVAVTKGFQDYCANFLVFVENNLTLSGATAAGGVIKDWKAKGGKVLAQSKPVPIKHIIASPSMSAADVDAVRDYLLSLDVTDDGKKKLAPTKWQGFVAGDQAALLAFGVWLGL